MKSILVMQLFRHDAVLQSTPALAALRANFPAARIHALVCKPFGEVLRGNPDADEVIEWDIDSLEAESADEEVTVERLDELRASLRSIREGRNFDAVYNLSATALSALVAYLLARGRNAAGLVFCRDRNYRVRNDWLRHLFAGGPSGGAQPLKIFNRADVFLRACGGQDAPYPLRIAVTKADERYAEEALAQGLRAGATRPIGVHMGAQRDCAFWPGRNLARLLGALRGAGHELVFFGGADERAEIAEVVRSLSRHDEGGRACGPLWTLSPQGERAGGEGLLNLAGNASFGQFTAFLKRCRLLISNNTMAANVAAAAGTPCLMVVPFSRDDTSGWEKGPYGEGHFVLEPKPSRSAGQSGEPLTPEVVLAAVVCALSDGREVPGPLKNADAIMRRSCWMPDGLWGLQPLTRPELTLKELLRLMLRSCLRQRRLAGPCRGDEVEWRPWTEEVFAWHSLDGQEALLREAARAAESFATLRRMAAYGVGTASAAVMQTSARADQSGGKADHRAARHRLPAHGFRSSEQRILALEENEALGPLIAGFRLSLPDIDALPPRQKAVAQRWNCHTLAEECAFMARSLRDFAHACEAHSLRPACVHSPEE